MSLTEDRFAYEGDRSVDLWTRTRAEKQVDEVQAALLDLRAAARACAERIQKANPRFIDCTGRRGDALEPGEAIEGIVECVEETLIDGLDAAAIEEARLLAKGQADD